MRFPCLLLVVQLFYTSCLSEVIGNRLNVERGWGFNEISQSLRENGNIEEIIFTDFIPEYAAIVNVNPQVKTLSTSQSSISSSNESIVLHHITHLAVEGDAFGQSVEKLLLPKLEYFSMNGYNPKWLQFFKVNPQITRMNISCSRQEPFPLAEFTADLPNLAEVQIDDLLTKRSPSSIAMNI